MFLAAFVLKNIARSKDTKIVQYVKNVLQLILADTFVRFLLVKS